jgi:hypothetical protein
MRRYYLNRDMCRLSFAAPLGADLVIGHEYSVQPPSRLQSGTHSVGTLDQK